MSTYVLYGRTSSDTQAKDETISTQLDAARNWAEAKGVTLAARYLDDGVSSKTPFAEREAGRRLLADARAAKFSHLLIYNFRRLGRDQLDSLQTLRTLAEIGVTVQSICEPMPEGSEGDIGVLMAGVFTSFGQYDWIQLRRLLDAGKVRCAAEGRWLGGPAPFGYRLARAATGRGTILERDERELAIVRRIFDLFLTGRYYSRTLAELLNAEGVPTPYGGREGRADYRWTSGRVSKVLANPVYAGRLAWRKTAAGLTASGKTRRVPSGRALAADAPHLAVVSEDEFARAERMRESNRTYNPRNGKRDYWLRGMVACGTCGKALCGFCEGTRAERPNHTGKYYYRCNSVYSKAGRCGQLLVNADRLESLVWQECRAAIERPAAHLDLLRLAVEEQGAQAGDPEAERARLESLREEARAARARALDMIVRGRMAESDAVPILERLEAETETLEREIARNESLRQRARDSARFLDERRRLLAALAAERDTDDPRRRRLALEAIASKVVVRHNERRRPPHIHLEMLT